MESGCWLADFRVFVGSFVVNSWDGLRGLPSVTNADATAKPALWPAGVYGSPPVGSLTSNDKTAALLPQQGSNAIGLGASCKNIHKKKPHNTKSHTHDLLFTKFPTRAINSRHVRVHRSSRQIWNEETRIASNIEKSKNRKSQISKSMALVAPLFKFSSWYSFFFFFF